MWSIVNDYALTGERSVLEGIRDLVNSLPVNRMDEEPVDYRPLNLHDLRKVLYGNAYQEHPRKICRGPGRISRATLEDEARFGGCVLRFSVETFKNFFESKRFIRALRKKFGKFSYAVLVDDTELCQDRRPFTTDRTGRLFPHFVLVEGTPDEMDMFPYAGMSVKETTLANTKELLKAFRERGFRFGSFKEFVDENQEMVIRNDDGETVIGVWGCDSPVQRLPDPVY